MFLLRAAAILLLFCGAGFVAGQENRTPPPKELVEYVKEAHRLGLSSGQVRQNAIKAGWPAATVDAAIAQASAPATPATSAPAQPSASQPKAAPEQPVTNTKPASSIAEPVGAPASDRGTQPKTHGVPEDYRIGAGDVLQISVYKEPDASVPSVVVRPDGRIGLPLLKEVEVIGLTPIEAEKVITEKLSRLIPAADVTVVVTAIHSKRIYVVGAVKKEGPIPYTYRMTVMQALSEAGGLTDYAKRKKIYVLRNENGKDYRLPFDYDAVLRGERMELNIPLLPNDTLVVPH